MQLNSLVHADVTLVCCSMADDGDNNSVFEGSDGSSVPRTPTEGPATPVSVSALEDKDSR